MEADIAKARVFSTNCAILINAKKIKTDVPTSARITSATGSTTERPTPGFLFKTETVSAY